MPRLLRLLLTIAVFACSIAAPDFAADAQDGAAVTESGDTVSPAAEANVVSPDSVEEKRQLAVSALLVLALVCIVFLFLILFVVMWARRMRRLVKQPLPDQHPGDPLWYLRKPDSAPVTNDED